MVFQMCSMQFRLDDHTDQERTLDVCRVFIQPFGYNSGAIAMFILLLKEEVPSGIWQMNKWEHMVMTLTCERRCHTYHGSHLSPCKLPQTRMPPSPAKQYYSAKTDPWLHFQGVSATPCHRVVPTWISTSVQVTFFYFSSFKLWCSNDHAKRCVLWSTVNKGTRMGRWNLYPIARREFWMVWHLTCFWTPT